MQKTKGFNHISTNNCFITKIKCNLKHWWVEKGLQVFKARAPRIQILRLSLTIQWECQWHTRTKQSFMQKRDILSWCVAWRWWWEWWRRRWWWRKVVLLVAWSYTNGKRWGRCWRWWCWRRITILDFLHWNLTNKNRNICTPISLERYGSYVCFRT